MDSPFHKYLFYFLGQRCIEFFRQWLGWIPSRSLCGGCSGPQAFVINPTFHRLLWVGRPIFELCHFLHPGLPPEKCRDLVVLPPSPPNLKNRALKGGTKQPLLKNQHKLFHPCFVFVVQFLRAEFRSMGRGVVCPSDTGLTGNTITHGLLVFSKAHYFACINKEACVHPK